MGVPCSFLAAKDWACEARLPERGCWPPRARDSRRWRIWASSAVTEEGSVATLEPSLCSAGCALRCLVSSDCSWAAVEPGGKY